MDLETLHARSAQSQNLLCPSHAVNVLIAKTKHALHSVSQTTCYGKHSVYANNVSVSKTRDIYFKDTRYSGLHTWDLLLYVGEIK